ncbi:hypothetical protein AB205_0076660 [Aquarana catesbeiana]|uniref:Uncharacterized protein n=1 Tax=Aquarana catesbeiana TaxID=8400 RepID=A0A2G9Q595_AQUCT|nr:hypothetical protein AB205_0076660 [Aquarana catesbeiana]
MGRLEAGSFFSFLYICVGPDYEGRLEAACLLSFLQVCIGLAMKEGWRPVVFSLFCRCVMDRL